MGRLFETETSKSSTLPAKKPTGRLFTEPVKKATLGEKVTKTAAKVTDFFGGTALAEGIGAAIAKKRVPEEQKQYITSPTGKQIAASALELGGNIALLAASGGSSAAATSANAANKTSKAVKFAKLAGEGAAYGAAQGGLRSVQEGNDVFSKETGTATAIGGAIGGVLGAGLGALSSKLSSPKIPVKQAKQIDEVIEGIPQSVLDDASTISSQLVDTTSIPSINGKPPILKNVRPAKETVQVTQPETVVPKSIPAINQQSISEGVNTLSKNIPDGAPQEIYNQGNFELWTKTFEADLATNPQLVEEVALGLRNHPAGVPADAYNRLLSSRASKDGNFDLINKLSDPSVKVSSISGQRLVANKLKTDDDVVDLIKEIKQAKFDAIGKKETDILKEVSQYQKDIDNIIKDFSSSKLSKNQIIKILDDLTCK